MIIDELRCKHCGSHDFIAANGFRCGVCGGVFLLKGTAFDYDPSLMFPDSSKTVSLPPFDGEKGNDIRADS